MTSYKIIVQFKDPWLDNDGIEEIAENLSYEELSEYLIDCYKEEHDGKNNIKGIKKSLKRRKFKPLLYSIEKDQWIFFNEYNLKIKEND